MGDPSPRTFPISDLVGRIGALEEAGGAWSLEAEEVRGLLGVGPEEFLRRIYAADRGGHPLVELGSATSRFSQDKIWEFVALVELFCGPGTEERLQDAGIFFTHPEQLEILGTFVAACSRAVREHAADGDEFSAMLSAFGSFERARTCYLEEHFRLDSLVEEAVEQYCAARSFGIPGLARRNARGLLGYFFQKHVLEPRDLFAGVSAILFEQAVREGYAEQPREEQGEAEGAARRGRVPDRLEQARRVLGLEDGPVTLPELKSQYKRLMKRYHPDLNPAGLARCQEITAAYSLPVACKRKS